MASREAGNFAAARGFFQRAGDKEADKPSQIKALFELVHTDIDEKKFDAAEKSLADFVQKGAEILGAGGKVAIDMQSTLLKVEMLERKIEGIPASNKAEADKLKAEVVQALKGFVDRYPAYAEKFMEQILKRMKGSDIGALDHGLQLVKAQREFSKQTPESLALAEEICQRLLKDPNAKQYHSDCRWMMGGIRNLQRKNDEAAAYWTELAEKDPAFNRGKECNARVAALNAVNTWGAVMKEKGLEGSQLPPTAQQSYVRALKVLVENWGRTDPEARKYSYELGLMCLHVKNTADGIKYLGQVSEGDPNYVHSRYNILFLRTEDLLDNPRPDRDPVARELVKDLDAFMRKAKPLSVQEKDPDLAKRILQFGASCGLRIAQIHKDVLKDPDEARRRAEQVTRDFAGASEEVERSAQQLVIEVLLEQGKAQEAIPLLIKLVEDSPAGAEKLMAMAVRQIGDRIERLMYDPDPDAQAKLGELRKAYRLFAQRLMEFATERKLPDQQLAVFKKALAHSLEFSPNPAEAQKGLALYQELAAQEAFMNDSSVVRGLARAYRSTGQTKLAMDRYDQLRTCLTRRSAEWWRAQAERLTFSNDIFAKSPTQLKRVLLQIRLLQGEDQSMGGMWKLFTTIQNRANELLREAGTAASEPASGEEMKVQADGPSPAASAPSSAPAKAEKDQQKPADEFLGMPQLWVAQVSNLCVSGRAQVGNLCHLPPVTEGLRS